MYVRYIFEVADATPLRTYLCREGDGEICLCYKFRQTTCVQAGEFRF